MWYVVGYVCFINLVAFCMYGMDKRKAKKRRKRISERALLLIAVAGGGIGAHMGMLMFHHKTQKVKFYLGIPILMLLQVALIMYLISYV